MIFLSAGSKTAGTLCVCVCEYMKDSALPQLRIYPVNPSRFCNTIYKIFSRVNTVSLDAGMDPGKNAADKKNAVDLGIHSYGKERREHIRTNSILLK